MECAPNASAMMNAARNPYLSHFFSGEYLKRNLFFFLSLPRNHEMMSCIMPRGHITEQYILPNTAVRRISPATTAAFNARAAGRNWIFAIHPSHVCTVPVKSRNRRVMHTKNMMARVILNFLSIVSQVCQFTIAQSKYSSKRRFALSSWSGVFVLVSLSRYSWPIDSYLCIPSV